MGKAAGNKEVKRGGVPQPGILAPLPPLGRYLFFSVTPGGDPRTGIKALAVAADGVSTVVGAGLSLLQALGRSVPGLRVFPAMHGAGFDVPSTQDALWIWLRGDDRGELMHRTHTLEKILGTAFRLDHVVDAFKHDDGRDLTGYEDGTENPVGEDAVAAACTDDGGSFVAVQQWVHDFPAFHALPRSEQDDAIGRRRDDNEELDDAPESAHVKRTAQESFSPEAFILRRSMPWTEGRSGGLLFVAFGHTLDAFEVQMRRMAGLEDGIVDALFRFSRPVSGGYYWCPPVVKGRLDFAFPEG
ncbi:MAG: Dyp-type peroxidase [Proteobacteria bacterium]|nr:Dyp-type peroxidase [Pseudomonadota bacterium]